MTCTFGRARSETAPARPDEIAWVASGVVAKRWNASAAGNARPKPKRARVPHLDDRRAADVEPHQRAAADLVDDRVGGRQRDALAGGGRGDRGRAAAVGGERGRREPVAGEEQPGRRGRVELRLADEPALGRPTPTGGSARTAASGWSRRGDEDQAAAQERRRRRSGPPPGSGRARCRRGGAPGPRRTLRRRRSRPRSRGLPRGRRRARSAAPMCSATTCVASTRKLKGPDPLSSRWAWSASARISLASAASRRPPGVRAIPRPLRTNRSSPSSLRSAETATETAGSVTRQLRGRGLHRPMTGHEHEGLELRERHKRSLKSV